MISFEERKNPEDKYIKWFLSKYEGYVQNDDGILPDITKPDGSYLEIKVIERDRANYNIVVQCHGFNERCEIDDWSENGTLDKTEFKIICPDKILVVPGKTLWETECIYFSNREKTYHPKHRYIIRRNEKMSKNTSSKTAFYLFDISKVFPFLERTGFEPYTGGKILYAYKDRNGNKLDEWM